MAQRSLFEEPCEPSFPSVRAEAPDGWVPLSSLAPDASPGKPPGIARLAAAAPEIDFRNEVEYRELPCRTLVSSVVSERVPFHYAINPYRGCEFGCAYCYARYTHEFMDLEEAQGFERRIFVKAEAREALKRDLRRLDLQGKDIAIGTATDPYQPAERRYGITRSLLELLAERRNLRLSVTTKSDLVARDAELLARVGERNELHVNVTVTTPHYELSRRVEPRAPRPDKRLAAIRTLAEAGVRTGVFVMPLLPRITDGLEDLDLLFRLAKDAGAQYLLAQPLFLRKCSKRTFFPFLGERFPELLPYYRRLYSGHHTEALANYARAKMAEVAELKRKHGLPGLRRGDAEPGFQPDQLALAEW